MTRIESDPRKTDIEDVSACACASLRKAARAVTQAYDDALRPAGLRTTQFTLLATLARRGGTPVTKLAEILIMDRTTLTRNLKPLMRRELIRIEQEDDQRVRKVVLSGAGRRAFENALPRWKRVQSQISDDLGQERLSGFLEDLSRTVVAAQGR